MTDRGITESEALYDVAVIGTGPAGLAAAGQAADSGARVVLIDAAAQFGGQFWRHADERHDIGDPSRWHHGWKTYASLVTNVRQHIQAGRIEYHSSSHVITAQARDTFSLTVAPVPEAYSDKTSLSTVFSKTLVLCPGAYDRQLPVPGWTLPGVMAAGGIQAFIKTQGVAPGSRVVLGGTGPFLLSAAASILHAGAEVVAICESSSLNGWFPRGAAAALAWIHR